jgi:hypothetical protein
MGYFDHNKRHFFSLQINSNIHVYHNFFIHVRYTCTSILILTMEYCFADCGEACNTLYCRSINTLPPITYTLQAAHKHPNHVTHTAQYNVY